MAGKQQEGRAAAEVLRMARLPAKWRGREMGAMTYGKLVNGRLVPAPNPLPVRNGEVRDPSGYLHAAVGYKLVVETPAPDTAADPSALTPHWEEWDGQIVRVWL